MNFASDKSDNFTKKREKLFKDYGIERFQMRFSVNKIRNKHANLKETIYETKDRNIMQNSRNVIYWSRQFFVAM